MQVNRDQFLEEEYLISRQVILLEELEELEELRASHEIMVEC